MALTDAQMDTITAGGGVGSIDPGCGGCSDATRYGGSGIASGNPIEDAGGGGSDPVVMTGPPEA